MSKHNGTWWKGKTISENICFWLLHYVQCHVCTSVGPYKVPHKFVDPYAGPNFVWAFAGILIFCQACKGLISVFRLELLSVDLWRNNTVIWKVQDLPSSLWRIKKNNKTMRERERERESSRGTQPCSRPLSSPLLIQSPGGPALLASKRKHWKCASSGGPHAPWHSHRHKCFLTKHVKTYFKASCGCREVRERC